MSDGHRSIGEVLDLLQEEFPDVTVSKIRFLESQGLIAPERTPSGYRKFYEPDIRRLRWILKLQRDHYLPLKVIKTRLSRLEEELAAELAEGPAPDTTLVLPSDGDDGEDVTVLDGDVTPEAVGETVIPDDEPVPYENGPANSVTSDAALTRDELARLAGVEVGVIKELESYGLLPAPRLAENEEIYDEHAVVVTRLARGFLRHGVEVRHLRMYKTFAQREADFVSQLVTPILRQRNPEARQQARETVSELARLGGGLRAAMLRVALREALEQ